MLLFIIFSSLVYHLNVNGVISPPVAEYVTQGIEKAQRNNASLVIISLDTPGGLDQSMRQIVKKELTSTVPVCVFVSPQGARAASAGTFITIAANFAAMSEGTSIGAAHPVSLHGKMDSIMTKKVENDAASYIKSISLKRGRNASIAELTVREATSYTEEEAKKLHLIDFISNSINGVIDSVSGKTTIVNDDTIIVHIKHPIVKEIGMTQRQKALLILSNPNIAYILMMLGIYGLFFELSHPGAILPGIIGGISLILAFYSFQSLPVNYAGVLLIVLGLIFFILEIKIVSHGLLSIGGVTSLVLGSLLLFKGAPFYFKISLLSIIGVTAFTILFFLWVIAKAYAAFRKRPTTGKEGMIGLSGIAKTRIDKKGGLALIRGELWKCRSSLEIAEGDEIVVTDIHGLTLFVKKKEEI